MRLINTSTGLFEEFIGRNIPKYAILSHTWGEEEVSFKDMADLSCKSKKEYAKIEMTCRLAAKAGLGYAWVDTCCIDKSSSAELTEAINSMFQWYGRAAICYVFLSDLAASAPLDTELQGCRWFTRGWTLQELIAPPEIEFYDQSWSYRGNKLDFLDNLARITGISSNVLQHMKPLSTVAVAQRMSWASQRQTTRIEDAAYCLLGIFDINMALLYGEEEKAFRRLQEEIIRTTPDYTIFAWTTPLTPGNAPTPATRTYSGILASSLLQFSKCGFLETLPLNDDTADFSVTNQGIRMHSRFALEQIPGQQGCRYIILVCLSDAPTILGIRLKRCGPNKFLRADPYHLATLTNTSWEDIPRNIYLLTQVQEDQYIFPFLLSPGERMIRQSRPYILQIRLPPKMRVEGIYPWTGWDDEDQIFFVSGSYGRDCGGAIIRGNPSLDIQGRIFPLGFAFNFYALGWSKLNNRQLKCTVVAETFTQPTVHKDITEALKKDCNAEALERLLLYYQVPQSSSVIIDVGLRGLSLLVYFTLTQVTDRSICQNPFWRVEFGWKVCDDNELPEIEDARWEDNRD